jgi:L-glyceraldehyde 3-phosphate reductase
MPFRRCGTSGLELPALALGLWHNFGGVDPFDNARAMVRRAFELGINHFDLANVYGPPPGSAEETFGRILREDLAPYRDELVIATKAGHPMREGPFGRGGSSKHLLDAIDRSLNRLGLDHVDLFYHHVPDGDTKLEETLTAMDQMVRSGRTRYLGISVYDPRETHRAICVLRELGSPCVVHQTRYNLLDRGIELELLPLLRRENLGCVVFSPLAQGLLSNRYLDGIPEDSRAAKAAGFLRREEVDELTLNKVQRLQTIAEQRHQTLAQMALSWIMGNPAVTSILLGASRVAQIEDSVAALEAGPLADEELTAVAAVLAT